MSQYILDTDHFTLLEKVHPIVTQRVGAVNPDDISITVVTAEEKVQGWLSAIRRSSQSSQPERLVWAYIGLRDVVKYINRFHIIDFSLDDYARFTELRSQKIRIGTQDLRIAAIALSRNAILVTRNQSDFAKVPGLLLADWTITRTP